jgi:murein DD-endopeptidase MepM/ murein hydrolase activator NlpD
VRSHARSWSLALVAVAAVAIAAAGSSGAAVFTVVPQATAADVPALQAQLEEARAAEASYVAHAEEATRRSESEPLLSDRLDALKDSVQLESLAGAAHARVAVLEAQLGEAQQDAADRERQRQLAEEQARAEEAARAAEEARATEQAQPAATPVVAPVDTAPPATTPQGLVYPLGGQAKLIGYPYQGSHLLFGNWESDNAVDLAIPVGTPVYAVAAGTIGWQFGPLASGDPHLQGQRLHLVTADDEYYYAHLSAIVVYPGQTVQAGQLLGYSGEANGVAHLHLGERATDPAEHAGTAGQQRWFDFLREPGAQPAPGDSVVFFTVPSG